MLKMKLTTVLYLLLALTSTVYVYYGKDIYTEHPFFFEKIEEQLEQENEQVEQLEKENEQLEQEQLEQEQLSEEQLDEQFEQLDKQFEQLDEQLEELFDQKKTEFEELFDKLSNIKNNIRIILYNSCHF
jgi:predicted transcriptional regulator